MDKRHIDEQLESLQFDVDDEIDDRNERRGWHTQPARHAYRRVETSHAIILAAIIIVAGLWGGKLINDYVQEQRLKDALIERADKFMDDAVKDLDNNTRQMQSDMQKRAAPETKAARQRLVDEDKKRLEEIAQAQQEKKFQSAQLQL